MTDHDVLALVTSIAVCVLLAAMILVTIPDHRQIGRLNDRLFCLEHPTQASSVHARVFPDGHVVQSVPVVTRGCLKP